MFSRLWSKQQQSSSYMNRHSFAAGSDAFVHSLPICIIQIFPIEFLNIWNNKCLFQFILVYLFYSYRELLFCPPSPLPFRSFLPLSQCLCIESVHMLHLVGMFVPASSKWQIFFNSQLFHTFNSCESRQRRGGIFLSALVFPLTFLSVMEVGGVSNTFLQQQAMLLSLLTLENALVASRLE